MNVALPSVSTTFAGTFYIDAATVPGGITSIQLKNTVIGTSNGISAKVTVSESTAATASKTVTELFGATFTDADAGDTFRGVTITSAGTAANASALGTYQYQKAGTTTWVTLAAGLTDSTSVFLAANDLVRFVPSTTNTDPTAKPDLVARLVDSSASTAPVTGAVIDVSGANNGGSTAYSGDTVTLRVEVNIAPVVVQHSFCNFSNH